ncbi:pirin-like C-terminal cupin domain-containing protein [Paenibacillus sp. BR2-3]
METVTYVISGQIEHYDTHSGEGGVLKPGDVQWMTAGSGVEHNEVPSEGVTAHSLQCYTVTQDLPGTYNGFIYVLEGSGTFGQNNIMASKAQVLWLEEGGSGESEVDITAINPLRVLLYAGEPLKEPVVARGPFVIISLHPGHEIFQSLK